jgi:hypothetical protein
LEVAQHEVYLNLVTLDSVAEGVLMRCTTDNLRWLARVLAGFSFSWEVRELLELEAALKEHAARIIRQLDVEDTSLRPQKCYRANAVVKPVVGLPLSSNQHTFYLVERQLITRPVIELGGSLGFSYVAICCAFASVPPFMS